MKLGKVRGTGLVASRRALYVVGLSLALSQDVGRLCQLDKVQEVLVLQAAATFCRKLRFFLQQGRRLAQPLCYQTCW